MSRSSGTYTAPTSGWKPAAEGSVIDSSDWNTLLDDLEAAVTETVYTGGLGATDNALVRTDGTDTKKAQGATPTISDTGILSGVATFKLTAYTDATLPAGTEGQIAYSSDWSVNGGASEGSLVFHDGTQWVGVDTGASTGDYVALAGSSSLTFSTAGNLEFVADFLGAFTKLSGNDSRDWRSGVAIPWTGADDVDSGGWHDPSSNNTRLTVPVGYNIERVRILANVYMSGMTVNSNMTLKVSKNGSETFDNFPINTHMGLVAGYTTGEWLLATESMPATAGDYFEIILDAGEGDTDGQTLLAANTFAMIEATHRTGETYSGANVTKSAATTGVNASAGVYTIAWDSELNDTGGWHDNVTNNTRLTVPSGVSRARAILYLRLANLNGAYVYMQITKNGATTHEGFVDKAWRATGSISTGDFQLVTADMPVSAGDYFEAKFLCPDTSVDIAASSRFVVEAVAYDSDVYALVGASGDQTADFTGGQVLTFNSETQDTGGWHDNASNNTRLTVPSGYNISHVDLTAYVRLSNIAGLSNTQFGYIAFRKNGGDTFVGKTAYAQAKSGSEVGAWEQVLNAYSVPCEAGDYFEVYYISGAALAADTSVTAQASRTFQARATRFDGSA